MVGEINNIQLPHFSLTLKLNNNLYGIYEGFRICIMHYDMKPHINVIMKKSVFAGTRLLS